MAEIPEQLARIRRETRARLVRGAVAVALAGAAGTACLSAVAVHLGLNDAAIGIGQSVFAFLGLGGVIVAALLCSRAWASDEAAVARRIDAVAPGARATETLELARDRGRYGESAPLADAAVQRNADRVRVAAERWGRLGQTWELRAWVVTGAASLMVLAMGVASPRALMQGLSAWSSLNRWDDPFERIPPEPSLERFTLTYRFPDYLERPPRTIRSADGAIEALPGTEVTVETDAGADLAQAVIEVDLGDGVARDSVEQVAAFVDGSSLRGTFVLRREGSYRIRLVEAGGAVRAERRGHPIRLRTDAAPEVELTQPETSPLEVNERDPLELEYTARDDFGLTEAVMRWRIIGSTREGAVPLDDLSGRTRAARRTRVDLALLELQPGDRVAYSVEVRDNDSVNGPKIGGSRTQELRVYSKEDHHRRVLDAQMKALDELVHLLGDNLEGPFQVKTFARSLTTSRRIVERARTTETLLEGATKTARDDPLGRPQVAEAFAETRRGLAAQRRRAALALRDADTGQPSAVEAKVNRAQDRMTAFLEKSAVYLADLLDDQRMIDAEALARSLREKQQELKEALAAYREAPTPEAREQLARAVQEIQQQIREIMQQLAQMQSEIPTDYVNREALQQDQAQMDSLSKMVEEGDLDSAMAQVDQMLQQTEDMLSRLREGRDTLQQQEYSEISQRAEEIWQELEDVTMRQEELTEQTEGVAEAARERMAEKVETADGFVDKQLARLARARAAVDRAMEGAPDTDAFEAARQRIADAETALQARDFGAAKDVLDRGLDRLNQLDREAKRRVDQVQRFGEFFDGLEDLRAVGSNLEEAIPQVEKVREDLDAITPPPDSVLSPQERSGLQELSERQRELQERAENLEQQIQELGEQVPVVGEESQETLQEIQRSMNEAKDMLGEADAPGGLGRERRALEGLRKLRGQLQQMGQPQGGGGGGGVPLPFGTRQPQPSGEGGSGREVRNEERVEIPKPEAFEAPTEFREELLEAAKQGTLDDYREAVRRYYEELVK